MAQTASHKRTSIPVTSTVKVTLTLMIGDGIKTELATRTIAETDVLFNLATLDFPHRHPRSNLSARPA
jgi:hypothetical protein